MTTTAAAASGTSKSKNKLGLCIVGCGQIATHHVAAIANKLKGNIILRALCDPSDERRQVLRTLPESINLFEKKEDDLTTTLLPPREFNSLDELIAADGDDDDDLLFFSSKIDIIFIAVPHDLHESLAKQALGQRNKIVVLEKPLAPTLESCNNLISLSEKLLISSKNTTMQQDDQQDGSNTTTRSSMLIVAEQSPYWEAVVKAKTMIRNGKIGRVVTASAYYYESMRDNVTSGSVDSGGGLGWRGSLERAGGGITIDGGLHWIRPLREMVGRIDEVVAVTRSGLAPELDMEGESLAHAIMKIRSPPPSSSPSSYMTQPEGSGCLVATYSCNMLATAPMAHDMCPYFRITGTDGELVITGDGLQKEKPGSGMLRLYDGINPGGINCIDKNKLGGFFLGFEGLWDEIYRICIENDIDKAHESVIRAGDDVKTVLAMYRSSKSNKWESTTS